MLYYTILLYHIIYIMEHWDSRPKVTVNVIDKLITLLLMLILSTVFTCVSYIKYLTQSPAPTTQFRRRRAGSF